MPPRNADVDASPDEQSRPVSSVPTPVEMHDEDLGDTMYRPSTATPVQEPSGIRPVSSRVAPPPDDAIIDTGAFSLSTELQSDDIGKSFRTVTHY